MAQFSDLDILQVGHTIQLAGAIYAGEGTAYLCFFPDEDTDLKTEVLSMTVGEWEAFVRQTDVMETEVLAKASDGTLAKVILRKSTRQIEQGVSWKVFRRDGYRCRYCAADDVPLTVDHLVLWEHGGPSTEANLVSACRKCNKVRGNTLYADWLKNPFYLRVSQNLSDAVRQANEAILATLGSIPIRPHKRGR